MNDKAQIGVRGFAFLMVAFLLVITLFATIDPYTESLDTTRNQTSLNCPGTPGFDLTDYENDTAFERQVRRPTCFVTGVSMVYFVGSVLIAIAVWTVASWRKTK